MNLSVVWDRLAVGPSNAGAHRGGKDEDRYYGPTLEKQSLRGFFRALTLREPESIGKGVFSFCRLRIDSLLSRPSLQSYSGRQARFHPCGIPRARMQPTRRIAWQAWLHLWL